MTEFTTKPFEINGEFFTSVIHDNMRYGSDKCKDCVCYNKLKQEIVNRRLCVSMPKCWDRTLGLSRHFVKSCPE